MAPITAEMIVAGMAMIMLLAMLGLRRDQASMKPPPVMLVGGRHMVAMLTLRASLSPVTTIT